MNSELEKYYQALGISAAHLSLNRLPFFEQAALDELEVVDIDFAGRAFVFSKVAAPSWRALAQAATAEKVPLRPASGFRSYLYQAKLIEAQLAKGRTIDEILTSQAIPGFSEHHTGRAVDVIGDPSVPESEFEKTDTYLWLSENAKRFDFHLSFPQGNQLGIIFEPWHWFYRK